MSNVRAGLGGFRRILERRESELVHALKSRDSGSAERSPDLMDELQLASERDMAIRNLDRESASLHQARAALRRLQDGTFGTCIDCEQAISRTRLDAVPWAQRCIRCQEAADTNGEEQADFSSQALIETA